MPEKTQAAVVERALKALPKTPDGIARSLRQRKITGIRLNGGECPITNYLKGELRRAGLSDQIHTTLTYVTTETWSGGASGKIADLPAHVSEFIGEFDSGQYPYLRTPWS
jgi:hypothetical protein